MTQKRFKTYFFRVDVGASSIAFHQMLNQISRMDIGARTVDVMGSPVRLSEFDNSHAQRGVLIGDMERVQMENLPSRARRFEESTELELGDDEGLGHQTAFLYDARQRILALQANVTGVGSARFEEYVRRLSQRSEQSAAVSFNVVMLRENAANLAFQADAEFKKITFSITNPDAFAETLEHLGGGQPIISTLLRSAAQDRDGSRLTVTLSAGRSNENLRAGQTKRILRLFDRAGQQGVPIEKLTATGAFGGENMELNFLPNKMCIDDTVEATRRSVPFSVRSNALLRAVERCSSRLDQLFPRDNTTV